MATIALVSCVKTKLPHAARAEELYASALFRALRAYAGTHSDRWYILSAEHGVLSPEKVVDPYEKTLLHMRSEERRRWATAVANQLELLLPPRCRIVFLAGQRYREHLEPMLRLSGHQVEVPFQGLRMGEQLRAARREA